MKKLTYIGLALLLVFGLAACGPKDDASKLVVGASPAPHAEILEFIQPLLKEKGIDLEVIIYNDYILPNQALDSGEIDANFFQHIPFLELQIADHGYDFTNAGAIHIEPMGIYSQRFKSLKEVTDGAEVYFSNSVADHGRVLGLLEQQGLITIDPKLEDKTMAMVDDVVENPRNLVFKTDFAPELLSQMYLNDEADLVIVNTNFAVGAGINPMKDSIALEGKNSPYVNIVAVQSKDTTEENIKALVEVLQSQEVKDFMIEKYEGMIVPV